MIFIKNIIKKIHIPNRKYLVAEISLIAFVVHIFIIIIDNIFLKNNETISLIVSEIGAIAFFGILGLAGLIVAIKQELPQVVIIQGGHL